MAYEIDINLEEIGKHMSRPVFFIDQEATVQDAALEMHAREIGSLLVKKLDTFVGIVSESDITRKVVSQGHNPENTRVADIMTKPILTIDRFLPVVEAENFMQKHRIRHLGVTEEGKIVGVISVKDLVACYSKSFRTAE